MPSTLDASTASTCRESDGGGPWVARDRWQAVGSRYWVVSMPRDATERASRADRFRGSRVQGASSQHLLKLRNGLGGLIQRLVDPRDAQHEGGVRRKLLAALLVELESLLGLIEPQRHLQPRGDSARWAAKSVGQRRALGSGERWAAKSARQRRALSALGSSRRWAAKSAGQRRVRPSAHPRTRLLGARSPWQAAGRRRPSAVS